MHTEKTRVGAQDVARHRQQRPDRSERRMKSRCHHWGTCGAADVGLGPDRNEEDRCANQLAHPQEHRDVHGHPDEPHQQELRGVDELTDAIAEHQAFLRKSKAIYQVEFDRVEQELGLIFKDELEKLIFKGLKGTRKKKEYIESIINRKNDPYSVVEDVLNTYLVPNE